MDALTRPSPAHATSAPTTTVGGDINTVLDTRDPAVLAQDLTVDRSCTVGAEPTVIAGADVVLRDADGTIIGRGSLTDGEVIPGEDIPANAVCRMSFRFSVVDEKLTSDFYELAAGDFTKTLAHDELNATMSLQVGEFFWH